MKRFEDIIWRDLPGIGDYTLEQPQQLSIDAAKVINRNLVDLLICVMKCDQLIGDSAPSTLKFVREVLSTKKKSSEECRVLFLLTHDEEKLLDTDQATIESNFDKLLRKSEYDIANLTRGRHVMLFVPIKAKEFVPVRNKINDMLQDFNIYHKQFYERRRDSLCRNLIWSFAGISAAFGLIPLVDIAMNVIINNNMSILLKAALGDDTEMSGSEHVINAAVPVALMAGKVSMTVLKAAFGFGQFLAKAADLTIIGIVVGEGLSVGLNFGYTLAHGYIIWNTLANKQRKKELVSKTDFH